jgi:hypothetical protein
MKRLVIDTANILFRVASAHGKYHGGSDTKDQAGLAMHMSLMAIRSQYNKHKPDQVAITFEGAQNWRKAHTRGERPEKCVSGRLYKGHRVKDDSMIPYFELMDAFKQLAIEHTSLVVLQDPELEGDDVFAGYVRKFSALGDEVIGLSDDKDFVQLLQLPNVKLVRPDGTFRGKDKDTGEAIDPKFFMYEKAFRGDVGDNVMPAKPKVFKTKLKAAYDALQKGDTYLHSNLMNDTWEFTDPTTGEHKTFKVGDLYEENILLMDLVNGQPPDIQAKIEQVIDHAVIHHGTFSLFHFTKFCGKFSLKKIADDATNFMPLLSTTGMNSPLKAETKAAAGESTKIKLKKRTSLVF